MDENLWHYAMEYMSVADVLTLCQINKWFEQLCQNELFWERKN